MDPAAFSAMRFAICAIPFLPFVFQARNDVQTRNAGMELGLWISLGYLIEALGLLTCDAGRASFISLFTVIHSSKLFGMLQQQNIIAKKLIIEWKYISKANSIQESSFFPFSQGKKG